MSNFTIKHFCELWGINGYWEPFYHSYGNGGPCFVDIKKMIHLNIDKVSEKNRKCALEIGCGNGQNTIEFLYNKHFKQIICTDVIPKPTIFKNTNINYIQILDDDNKYDLSNIENESIDFVFSFGVFCHFSNTASEKYLKSIFKKMNKNSNGLIMFPDWERNKDLKNIENPIQYTEKNYNTWFYYNKSIIEEMFSKNGFCNIKDCDPNFRDMLVYFEKSS